MKLEEIIKNIQIKQQTGDVSKDIAGIHIDSRLVEENHLFVAVRGTQTDGHNYITKAIEKGATAIVCETLPEHLSEHVTYLQVADTEAIVGELALSLIHI